MFEAFVITLREGVEAALVLGIAATLLRRRGLERLIPMLLAGAGAALLGSIGIAWLATRVTYNEEITEGIAMLVGAVLVFALVWWMWKAAPRMKQEVEHGIERAAGSGGGRLGLFLFAFAMVLREGAETAIFLSASSLNSEGLGRLLGSLAGLLLATTFGVLFARGTLRVPLKPFFSLTSAVLVLIGIQLLVGGLHELSEGQVLPASRVEMAMIGPLVKNELLVFTLTVAMAAAWLLFGPRGVPTASTVGPAPAAAEGPQARLERAARMRDESRRRWTGILAVIVVGFLSVAFVKSSSLPAKEPGTTLAVAGGGVRVTAADLADGRMHFYEADLPAGHVRFFAVKEKDHLHTCLDACEICGDKGYFMDGDHAVCRNCTSPIPLASLGRTGGCNPIPLPSRADAGGLWITASDLERLIPKQKGR